jgi:hypothetical protein
MSSGNPHYSLTACSHEAISDVVFVRRRSCKLDVKLLFSATEHSYGIDSSSDYSPEVSIDDMEYCRSRKLVTCFQDDRMQMIMSIVDPMLYLNRGHTLMGSSS